MNAVSLRQAQLVAGGRPITITIKGKGLDSLTGAFIASRGRSVPDTRADLPRTRSQTSRDVRVVAGPSAPTGTWELRLAYRDARGRARTIVAPVRVEISARPDRPRRREALVVDPPSFEPVSLTTEPLQITGQRFVPVALTTEPLQITGQRFVPVHIRTGDLRITGQREEN